MPTPYTEPVLGLVRAPRSATCRGARPAPRPGRCWSARSCCSRRRSPGCCRPTRPGWPGGRRPRAGGRRRPARRSGSGGGSATRGGRCGCTRRRQALVERHGGRSRRPRTPCWRCPGSAPTPPRRWPASPSGSGTRCWTPTSGGCWPGWSAAGELPPASPSVAERRLAESLLPERARGGRPLVGGGDGTRARWSARPPVRGAPACPVAGHCAWLARAGHPADGGPRRSQKYDGHRPAVPRAAARGAARLRGRRCRARTSTRPGPTRCSWPGPGRPGRRRPGRPAAGRPVRAARNAALAGRPGPTRYAARTRRSTGWLPTAGIGRVARKGPHARTGGPADRPGARVPPVGAAAARAAPRSTAAAPLPTSSGTASGTASGLGTPLKVNLAVLAGALGVDDDDLARPAARRTGSSRTGCPRSPAGSCGAAAARRAPGRSRARPAAPWRPAAARWPMSRSLSRSSTLAIIRSTMLEDLVLGRAGGTR